KKTWVKLLEDAIRSHSDEWLAQQLLQQGLLLQYESKKKPTGGFTQAKVPVNAHEMLAEGEFNRFYIRGVCIEAISRGDDNVIVYRAKEVGNPRPESAAKIGKRVPPRQLLEDLRNSIGTDTALGLPQGPNSGLSVKLA
ncbi:hypothetical protein F2S88_30545, partial [Pseudomonas syringae pv. actinidiae]|nr:hypothetical protein [Pseudomonas syringae pv. actinidiae]